MTTAIAVLALIAIPAAAEAQVAPGLDAELVTAGQHVFTATWTTAASSDTTVCLDGERPCRRLEGSTRNHYAHVTGLRSGRRYTYTLMSGGVPVPTSATNPGAVTTLVDPPGRFLFSFAVMADIHSGEQCSGTALTITPPVGSLPPCYSTEPPDPPYAVRMAEAAVGEINRRGVGLVVLTADNTSHAKLGQTKRALRTLRRLDGEWHITRGAHDRPNQNPPDPTCGEDNDCFRSVFFPARKPGRIHYSFDFRGHHFVALDSVAADGQGDLTDAAQNEWLERDLDRAKQRNQRTFIFFHHPVAEYATTTSFPPVIFGVRQDRGGQAFLDRLADYPNVVGVLNSHTHRNYVAYSPQTGRRLPFIETGPTKEYPGGYSMFRVYSGGYQRDFHRLRCDFCREWTATTRNEYFGLYPLYTLGTVSARAFTHVYDCDAFTPPPSPPSGNESSVGGDTVRPVCE